MVKQQSTHSSDIARLVDEGIQHDITMALVSVTIEKALLDFGKPLYNEVCSLLYKKYHAFMPDCFEHPEYLRNVLNEIYGKASEAILRNIGKELNGYEYSSVVKFVKGLAVKK